MEILGEHMHLPNKLIEDKLQHKKIGIENMIVGKGK